MVLLPNGKEDEFMFDGSSPTLCHEGFSIMLSDSGCDLFGNNRFPDWCKCNACQLQVLDGKWDADDGAEAQDRRDDVTDGKPDPSKDEPDDVPDHAQPPRTDVVLIRQFLAADSFFSKGEECELSNDEASLAPRDPDAFAYWVQCRRATGCGAWHSVCVCSLPDRCSPCA